MNYFSSSFRYGLLAGCVQINTIHSIHLVCSWRETKLKDSRKNQYWIDGGDVFCMSTVQLAENNAIGSYCKCVLSQITKLQYNFGEEVKKNTTFCVLCMFRMTLSSSVAADGMQRAIFLLSRHWQTYSFFARNIRHLQTVAVRGKKGMRRTKRCKTKGGIRTQLDWQPQYTCAIPIFAHSYTIRAYIQVRIWTNRIGGDGRRTRETETHRTIVMENDGAGWTESYHHVRCELDNNKGRQQVGKSLRTTQGNVHR